MQTKSSKGTVLVVDDEEVVLPSVHLVLRRTGYDVLLASSARSALAILGNRRVDVIVTDERMPGMHGAAMLAEVARAYPDVVRIVLSGAGFHAAARAVNQARAFRFLPKPCATPVLLEAIGEAMLVRNASLPPPASAPLRGGSTYVRTPSGAFVIEGLQEALAAATGRR